MYAQDTAVIADDGQAGTLGSQGDRHPDFDIDVRIGHGPDGAIYIYHDKPFAKELSWLEYDMDRNSIDFIMDDGDLRNFGIPVDPQYNAYLQNNHTLGVIRVENMKTFVSGEVLPLIVHRA